MLPHCFSSVHPTGSCVAKNEWIICDYVLVQTATCAPNSGSSKMLHVYIVAQYLEWIQNKIPTLVILRKWSNQDRLFWCTETGSGQSVALLIVAQRAPNSSTGSRPVHTFHARHVTFRKHTRHFCRIGLRPSLQSPGTVISRFLSKTNWF